MAQTKLQKVKKLVSKHARARGLHDATVTPAHDAKHKYRVTFTQNNTQHTVKFGSTAYQDYLDHHDQDRRRRYLARATNITDKSGKKTANNPLSPNYWSTKVLW